MSDARTPSNANYAKSAAGFAEGTPLQLALREIQRLLRSTSFWGGLVAVTFVLAIAAPFRTSDELNFAQRLAYWGGISVATYFPATFISMFVGRSLSARGLPEWLSWAVGGLVAAVPTVAIVLAINVWIVDFDADGAPPLWVLALQCAAISVAIVALHYLIRDRGKLVPAPARLPLIQSKLPLVIRAPVQHLVMQDHYVRVTTAKGSELVLMRMADAVASLHGVDGLQVHRSHWVARDAVVESIRERGKYVLILRDGTHVPVSRTHAAAVKTAGLI